MQDDSGQRKKVSKLVETSSTHCDICGAETTEIHCKVVCRNCGYTRDCSDP